MTDNDSAHHDTANVEPQAGGLAVPDHTPPQRIYLIPVKHRPFMPGLVQPVMLDKNVGNRPWSESARPHTNPWAWCTWVKRTRTR